MRSSDRELEEPAPARERAEDIATEEVVLGWPVLRHEHRHHAAAALGGDVGRHELALVQVGRPLVHERRVPVEVAVRGSRHVGHELDVLVAETAEEGTGDELDTGAGMPAAHFAEPQELVACREVRRRRSSGAVDLGHDVRGGEAQATGRNCL